ncbi:MAG TPA: O-antigen ligase family protein [bacterium]|nr:O-antigen ligase family protein [bacterium]
MGVREKVIEFCSRLQRYGIYSLIFFIPVYFAWFQENYTVFDLNKAVAMHVILSIVIVSWLTEICLTRQCKWGGNKILGIMGIVLGIVFFICTIFSIHLIISFLGSYERQQGLYNLLSYLGVSLFILIVIKNIEYLKNLISALLLGSAVVCIYGLIQAFGLDFLNWGEPGIQRIFSSFGQPNFLGHYIVVVFPFTLYAIFFLSRNLYIRFLYIILAATQVACLIFTLSRGAWIAFGFSLFLFVIWYLIKKNKRKLAFLLIFSVIIISILLCFNGIRKTVLVNLSERNFNTAYRLVSIFNFQGGSNKIRLYYWHASFHIFSEAPLERKLFGYGPDVLPDLYVKAYQPEWGYYERINSFPDRAHNFIIDIIFQFGVFGFLVLTFLFGYILRKLIRYTWNESNGDNYWLAVSFLFALIAYGINNLFSFSLVGMNVILYSLLAGAWLVGNNFLQKEYKIKFFQPLSLFVLSFVFSLFLLMLIYNYNIKPLVADYYYFNVKKAEIRGDCRLVLDNMEKTLEWYPVSHYYARAYLHHGTNCFLAITDKASQKQLADNLLEQAARIPKSDWQYLTMLDFAHMYGMLAFYIDDKHYGEAESIYNQLLVVGPMITTTYQDFGRMRMTQGKYKEAISLFQKGIEISKLDESRPPIEEHVVAVYRQVAYFYNLLGVSLMKEKKYDQAIVALTRSIELNPFEGTFYKDIADFYYQNNNISEAIKYNNMGSKVDPLSQPWAYLLALLYNDQGNTKKALEYAQRALEQDPSNQRIITFVQSLRMK